MERARLPRSIPELLDWALEERKVSERAASMYIGATSSNSVNRWRRGLQTPDPESCRKLAAWAGYPEEFVLQLAGHLSALPQLPEPQVEVIGVILRSFSREEQRRYLLPWLETAKALREDSAAGPGPPAAGSPDAPAGGGRPGPLAGAPRAP